MKRLVVAAAVAGIAALGLTFPASAAGGCANVKVVVNGEAVVDERHCTDEVPAPALPELPAPTLP